MIWGSYPCLGLGRVRVGVPITLAWVRVRARVRVRVIPPQLPPARPPTPTAPPAAPARHLHLPVPTELTAPHPPTPPLPKSSVVCAASRKRKVPQAWWAKAPTQVPCFWAFRTEALNAQHHHPHIELIRLIPLQLTSLSYVQLPAPLFLHRKAEGSCLHTVVGSSLTSLINTH